MPGTLVRRIAAPTVALVLLCLALPAAAAFRIQEVKSPGGIVAWLMEDHTNPVVALDFAFTGGANADPADRQGRASMVAALLTEGAGDLDSDAFRQILADRSISLEFSAGRDEFWGGLFALTTHRDKAFELLRLALTAPRFDDAPVARVRGQILASLRSSMERPQTIAGAVWRLAAFPEHVYGRAEDGTPETVARITVADMRSYVAERFARKGLTIGIVGDVTPEEAGRLIDQVFGSLPAEAPALDVPEATPRAVGEVMVVRRPVPQSVVMFGHAGIKRDDPDFYAASLLMEIMGGGLGSRLTEEIREKRGLAYGVFAYLVPRDHGGLVLGNVATQNARVAESIDLIRQEWRRMAEDGPTEAEVADAKAYLTGSYPLRFTGSGAIARTLNGLQRENLGIDYIERRKGLIEGVTMEELRRVAKRLFRADDLTFSVVGQPAKVEPTRPAPDPTG